MILTAIAAYSRQRAIGASDRALWHLPEDYAHFVERTTGHTLLVGRRTYESMGGALPNRRTIVLTRDPTWSAPDAEVAHCAEEALAMTRAAPDEVVYNGGGGEIYALLMPWTERMLITEVDIDAEGDASFPAWDPAEWVEVSRRHQDAAVGSPAYDRVRYDRVCDEQAADVHRIGSGHS